MEQHKYNMECIEEVIELMKYMTKFVKDAQTVTYKPD
jgi:hypothetical protein